jgi:hypothetical protein
MLLTSRYYRISEVELKKLMKSVAKGAEGGKTSR